MTVFRQGNASPNQHPNYAPPPTAVRNVLVLAANTAQAFTVPSGYTKVYMTMDTPGLALWVDENKTAVIPTGNITDGTAPMLNPYGREVRPGASLSCICASACTVLAEFYE